MALLHEHILFGNWCGWKTPTPYELWLVFSTNQIISYKLDEFITEMCSCNKAGRNCNMSGNAKHEAFRFLAWAGIRNESCLSVIRSAQW